MEAEAPAARFQSLAEVAGSTTSAAFLLPPLAGAAARVLVKRGQRDIASNKSRTSLQTFAVTATAWADASPPTPLGDAVVACVPSPSGRFLAVLKKEEGAPGSGTKAKTLAELWSAEGAGALLRCAFADAKLHGDVVSDAWYSSLSWSPCERFLAYVAEPPAPHADAKSFFDDPVPPSAAEKAGLPAGNQFDVELGGREDFGEKYVGVRSPRIFVVDWAISKVVTVPGIPDGLAAGQPAFDPSTAVPGRAPSLFLVYTGWTIGSRRLGSLYCHQRPAALYAADLAPLLLAVPPLVPAPALAHYLLTQGEVVSRSARFSPRGDAIAYLSMGGTSLQVHNGPSALRLLNWSRWRAHLDDLTKAASASASADIGVIDPLCFSHEVTGVPSDPWRPAPRSRGTSLPTFWPGITASTLPARCWADDGRTLFLTSQSASQSVVYRVDTSTGSVAREEIACSVLQPVPGSSSIGGLSLEASSSVHDVLTFQGRLVLLVSAAAPGVPEQLGLLSCSAPTSEPADESEGAGESALERWLHWAPSWGLAAVCPSALQALWAAIAEGGALAVAASRTRYAFLALASVRFSIFAVPAPTAAAAVNGASFEAILLHPAGVEGPLPLIVMPHGGPHSAFTTSFVLPLAFLVGAMRYAVLLVNYRGSTGFGEASLASLPGHCGEQDVADVMQALRIALDAGDGGGGESATPLSAAEVRASAALREKLGAGGASVPAFDRGRLSVCGGSHGGFLACHMIGHPASAGVFRTAVSRNPVTNIPAMITTSDIPDWCLTEACGLGSWPAAVPAPMPGVRVLCAESTAEAVAFVDQAYPVPSSAQLSRMQQCSPLALAPNVRAALLLMLGLKDRRVPASQGSELYYVLKAAAEEAKAKGLAPGVGAPAALRALMYPDDTHALDKPGTEADAYVNIALFFETIAAR